jgi:hypothetical protein
MMEMANRKAKQKRKAPAPAAIAMSEILKRPGISPEQLHKLNLIPVSRNAIYDACNRGEIECFRIGRRIIIPTGPLRRKLGMEAA